MYIYKITHIPTGKIYIGQTINKDPWKRIRHHFTARCRASMKKVKAINIATTNEYIFESVKSASLFTGCDPTNISRVCRKDQNKKQSKGWTFEFI